MELHQVAQEEELMLAPAYLIRAAAAVAAERTEAMAHPVLLL